MGNAATAAVRATCHVESGTDGAPLVTLSLDIASWIILDHDQLDEQAPPSLADPVAAADMGSCSLIVNR